MTMPEMPEEMTPELEELLQEEPVQAVVDVDVRGPVRVQALPARSSVMRSLALTDQAESLSGRDLRRARLRLWATAAAPTYLYVGTSMSQVAEGTAAMWPVGDPTTIAPPLLLEHTDGVYARARTGESVQLSVIAEQWAD